MAETRSDIDQPAKAAATKSPVAAPEQNGHENPVVNDKPPSIQPSAANADALKSVRDVNKACAQDRTAGDKLPPTSLVDPVERDRANITQNVDSRHGSVHA